MRERGVLTKGDTIAYAFAITRGMHRGRETWGHGGSDAGFRSMVMHIPSERLGTTRLPVVVGDRASIAQSRQSSLRTSGRRFPGSITVLDSISNTWSTLTYERPSGWGADYTPSGTSRDSKLWWMSSALSAPASRG